VSYKLRREVADGKVESVSLGIPEVDAYLKFLRYRCRLNTWINYGYDLQIFLNFIEKPLTQVTPTDILAFIESQQGSPNRQGRTDGLSMKGPGLSNRTIKRRLTAVAGFYEYLRVFHDFPLLNNPVPRGLTKRNIFWSNRYGNAAVTPLIRAPETLPRPLNPEEIRLFLDSLRNHRDKAMVLLMLLAGLRKSEVLKLTLKDIDFGQRTLTVREGKGGYQRVVAISDTGLQELLSYLNKEKPAGGSDRVFLCHERETQEPAVEYSGPGYHHRVPPREGGHSWYPVPSPTPHMFHPAAPGRYVTGSPASTGGAQECSHHKGLSTSLPQRAPTGIPADV